MHRVARKLLRGVANYDPDYYDMFADPNEACFSRLYLERIRHHAEAAGIRPPATVLEAGCQAGRLVIPFASQGFRVTGVDTSGFALRRARSHAQSAGVDARLIRGEIIRVVQRHPDWQFDLVVCAEVVYLSRQYREMVRALAGVVRPGGLLCVSHRPKFYYLIEALKQYDVESAGRVWRSVEGSFRNEGYYNWQTREDLQALYETLGLDVLGQYPIDRFAWLSGVSPGQWSPAQQQEWLQLELGLPVEAAPYGRYVLVIARRRPA